MFTIYVTYVREFGAQFGSLLICVINSKAMLRGASQRLAEDNSNHYVSKSVILDEHAEGNDDILVLR